MEENDNCPRVYTLPSPDHVNLYDFDKYLKWMYNPLSPTIHIQILQTDLNTFPYRISWENLFKDQRSFSEVIIIFILINFSFNKVLTLLGEIWCWPLLGPKGLICDEQWHIRQEKKSTLRTLIKWSLNTDLKTTRCKTLYEKREIQDVNNMRVQTPIGTVWGSGHCALLLCLNTHISFYILSLPFSEEFL